MSPFSIVLLGKRGFSRVLMLVSIAVIASVSLSAQAPRKAALSGGEDESGIFKDYRGVGLGMTSDEVRKKLGEPRSKSDAEDFFMFNDTESVQIVYDKTRKVVTISADFMMVGNTVPTAKQIFGAEIEPKADGSVYRMVRYTKAGYWVSYNRTGGDAPLTTVTLQKIQ